MELCNEFVVPLNIDNAWAILTDIKRIAPCMPGTSLEAIDGDAYHGVVKVRVGPISAQYKGTGSFIERDDASYRAVIRAEGRDTRGQGNANATITATLADQGDSTTVTVVTDLAITAARRSSVDAYSATSTPNSLANSRTPRDQPLQRHGTRRGFRGPLRRVPDHGTLGQTVGVRPAVRRLAPLLVGA